MFSKDLPPPSKATYTGSRSSSVRPIVKCRIPRESVPWDMERADVQGGRQGGRSEVSFTPLSEHWRVTGGWTGGGHSVRCRASLSSAIHRRCHTCLSLKLPFARHC